MRIALKPALVLALAMALLGAAPALGYVAHIGIPYQAGIPLAEPDLNSLDVYMPDAARDSDSRPVVVYVHGGGWSIGDKGNQITNKANLFTAAGYVFVSVNYRLSPTDATYDPGRIRFPDHPDDVGGAIGWVSHHIDNYGGDPTRLVLIGHSAGAHLVSLVTTDRSYIGEHGVEPWQIAGTVALDSDAFDIADRIAELGPNGRPTFYNAFGTPQEEAADPRWAAASPLLWADPGDSQFLLVTQAANPDRISDNQRMAAALGQNPSAVFLAPYDHEGINDAVGSVPGGETAAIMGFIGKRLEAAKEPRVKLRHRPPKVVHSNGRRARVTFSLDSPSGSTDFECRLDSPELRPCKRRVRLDVARGRHAFRYRAIAASGRPGEAKRFDFRVVMGA